MRVECDITPENDNRVKTAFAQAFPVPEGQKIPADEWVNLCVRRFIVGTVARYEQAVKQQSIQLEPDHGIIAAPSDGDITESELG